MKTQNEILKLFYPCKYHSKMIPIFEEEDIPMNIIKPKINFNFKGPHIKDIFDREFWNMTQVHIKGKMLGYSKTTRLLFALYIDENGKKNMQLIAWKNKEGKFISKNDCNKDILNWCRRSGIQV
jgi:hypothetical protein